MASSVVFQSGCVIEGGVFIAEERDREFAEEGDISAEQLSSSVIQIVGRQDIIDAEQIANIIDQPCEVGQKH